MFFTSASKKQTKVAEQEITASLERQKDEIRRKLARIDEVNQQLTVAVKETQAMSVDVIEKIKSELKVAKKSLASICKKLKEGVVILDYSGRIIQLNKAGEKIFRASEGDVVGKTLYDVLSCLNPTVEHWSDGVEHPIVVEEDTFLKLSEAMTREVKNHHEREGTYEICNSCLTSLLPSYLTIEHEMLIKVQTLTKRTIHLGVTFSILDNDPECLTDVSYVFLFTKQVIEAVEAPPKLAAAM